MRPVRYEDFVQISESTYEEDQKQILELLEKMTVDSREKERQGRAVRSAHAKSYGIVRSEFTVHDNLPPEYSQGIYSSPATFQAVVRFSNGLGHLGPDATLGPIFGMGVKLFAVPGRSTLDDEPDVANFDMAMINGPVFFANTAADYFVIQRLFDGLPGTLRNPATAKQWLHAFLTRDGTLPPEKWLWDEVFALMSLVKTPFQNPLLSSYWTMGALRHGEYIAKLRAVPDPTTAATLSLRDLDPLSDPEVIRNALIASFAQQGMAFEIQAQLCVDFTRMPVENTSIEWAERLSPFIPIAGIRIPKQDISSMENLDFADRTSITPWRTREDHIPLGEIMTVRKEVYRRSARLRREMNNQLQKEPANADEALARFHP